MDADLGKSALMRTARLTNNPVKGPQRNDRTRQPVIDRDTRHESNHGPVGCISSNTMRAETNSNDFGGFLELTSRFEFDFLRPENYFF